ncbi:MAG: putative sulfate exporter family transporter [Luteolibacter sp.]
MNESAASTPPSAPNNQSPGWRELWLKEDWWAVWIGLGLVIAGWAFFATGSSINWIAVAPAKWANFQQLQSDLASKGLRYAAQFGLFLALFTTACSVLGHKVKEFVPSFLFIYVLSLLINILGAWEKASLYTLEPPLVALLVGLIISNGIGLPRWLDAGFRVEFYVKTGIVLLGAQLPFTLILWAGPVAILQASIVSIATFLTIFLVGRRLGMDRRLCATLGAGGAVCGVSAAIAIAGAVRAKKEHPPIAITLVVLYAIVLVFALPLVARALHLPAGIGGAWIGTSEFADAAGLAAAQSYGQLAGPVTGIAGTPEQAINAYTLIKVVGRDVWIGIWAFVLSIVSITWWEKSETGRKADAAQIWWRFPKFVVGFLISSIIITLVVRNFSFADFNKLVKPNLVAPLIALRTWAFTFCFLSIGLTTRLREFKPAGGKPFWAFTAGVVINLILGYILSVHVFGNHWTGLGH